MANVVNYADKVSKVIEEKYLHTLLTKDLGVNDPTLEWDGAETIKVPTLEVGGFGEHSRDGGWNRKSVSNDWTPYKARHDRDVEFYVDKQQVKDTNNVLNIGNIANKFIVTKSVEEKDSYRISTIASDWDANGGTPITTALTASNILTIFDDMMFAMNEAGVPEEGRILYLTNTTKRLFTEAIDAAKMRNIADGTTTIVRGVNNLDNVKLIPVPAARMKDGYVYTDGCEPAPLAKQINMLLIHPSSVMPVLKTQSIYFFEPGQHTSGDGYLYQHRELSDILVKKSKIAGIAVHKNA